VVLLYLIGFVAGIVAGISPCILPVLPVILVAGVTTPVMDADAATSTADAATSTADAATSSADAATPTADATTTATATTTAAVGYRPRRSYRAFAVIGGLVTSFSVFTLVGSSLLSALGLPQDFLRDAGLVILGVVAVGLMFPVIGEVIERPFARLTPRRQPTGDSGAFVLGLGLGVLFVPCAGPVLSAITAVGASHRVGWASIVLTVDFAAGAAVPLLAFALAGQRAAATFRAHAVVVRRIGGAVLAVMTLVLAFNWTDWLQTVVPGYTSALQHTIEGNSYARKQLQQLTGTAGGSLAHCTPGTAVVRCGQAPGFKGITAWLNTPGGRPVTLASLRGRVVLVDFWTYSCINCQRSLPHVEAWYSRYHADGLEVVGVHTPEFAFEHVVSNVTAAARTLGVHYPIAIDNNYKTWDAYSNTGWPADYLIDATGQVRNVEIGEGAYSATETLIRQLLVAARPKLRLPPRTDVPNRTPDVPLTPESYLGYDYSLRNLANARFTPDRPAAYQFPASLPADYFALAGTWSIDAEDMVAGGAARLELAFQADDVYLVLGGSGTLEVSVNGRHTETIDVSGIPRLYTLVHGSGYRTATLALDASAGIKAYDFTFG
jgi:cytochrome c biogenesis protein CcdA/thiol-disulfide isomerase/thioredoxin